MNESQRGLMSKLIAASEIIDKSCKMSKANYVIVNAEMTKIFFNIHAHEKFIKGLKIIYERNKRSS